MEEKKTVSLLNELSEKGWELVSIAPTTAPVMFTAVPVTKTLVAIFKREKNLKPP